MALFCFNPRRWTSDILDIILVCANNHLVMNLLHLMSKIRKLVKIKIQLFFFYFSRVPSFDALSS